MADGGPYRPVVADRDVHSSGVSFRDEAALVVCRSLVSAMVGVEPEQFIEMADEIADVCYTLAEAMVRRKIR